VPEETQSIDSGGDCVDVVSIGQAASELIGISMPYIAALWLLVLGARFANRRMSVVIVSAGASILLLLQCAILGVGILLSPYHFEHRTQFQLLLAVLLVTGVAFVWLFIHAKWSRAKTPA
jgi:hypothetical protein